MRYIADCKIHGQEIIWAHDMDEAHDNAHTDGCEIELLSEFE